MSLRYPGGLITKNPVVPSTSSAAGIWTLEQALEYIKAGTWPSTGDPYFEYVTMLLHGNGTNGAQNNTFLDSSTNAFSITRNGNTTQGAFSPFSRADGGWSNYFDGTGDSLSWSGTTLSADFTVECWVYKTAVDASGYTNVFSSSGANNQLSIDSTTAGSIGLTIAATTVISPSGTAVTANTWHHLAWVREGSTCRVYVNGVQRGTGTSSASLNLTLIGQFQTGGYEMNGYISNVRITNACLYPSGTAFTPSTTPLTTTVSTGTVQLLTCQSNRFKDNSTNAFTITLNGTPSVQAFGPFNPATAYSTTTTGGSGYFDGSGDYLTVPDNAAFDMGTGDVTIEAWIYVTNIPSATLQGFFGNLVNGYEVYMYPYGAAGTISIGVQTFEGGYQQIYTTTNNVRLNEWTHVAFTRASGTNRFFVNGALCGTTGTLTNPLNAGGTQEIGRRAYNPTDFFFGYMSSLRVVKGTAVYTANFTPPTAPLTAISGTSLLCNFTNGGIFDNAAMNDLETVGNAQISTAQSKFGGGSMLFDGSGDRLQGRSTPEVTFGTGDFTVEGWLYLNSVASLQMIFDQRPASTNGAYPLLYMNGAAMTWYVSSADRIVSSSLTTGTWYHFAVSRSGASTKMFINGTQSGSTYTDSTTYLASSLYIGASAFDGGGVLNGYLDDFRITKGVARYTANFTPPTDAFPNF